MRIALQPASLDDREVAQHYQDTIDRRVRFADHSDILDGNVLTALGGTFPDGTAQLWGATPGMRKTNVTKWSKLREGDAVFFYGQKRLYLAGRIGVLFQNAVLAERLWGRNRDDLTWELMFALTGLREITIPIEEVRQALNWSDKAFVQGFTVVHGEAAENLADLVNLDLIPDELLSPMERHVRKAIAESATAPDGPTNETTTANRRREHPAFKKRLVELSGNVCALCGKELPPAFLVAAHIKKRAFCSEDERKDFDNVGMLACLLGCDGLFERGFVAVGEGGEILVSDAVAKAPHVAEFVTDQLTRRNSPWWNEQRDRYFAWHRDHTFIRTHDGSNG